LQYIVPFFRVITCLDLTQATRSSRFVRPLDEVIDVIRHLLIATPLDETWYLTKYPDVRAALTRNTLFKSAKQHFVTAGYFEGRLAFARETDESRHPLAFSMIKSRLKAVPVRGRLMVEFTFEGFLDIIRRIIVAVPVDAAWYSGLYPEVAVAVSNGRFRSAREHFVLSGYFENRLPYDMRLNEDWYVNAYSDLQAAKRLNPSFRATNHFIHAGYKEGRRPHREALKWIAGVP
jgi:hypothetical protein